MPTLNILKTGHTHSIPKANQSKSSDIQLTDQQIQTLFSIYLHDFANFDYAMPRAVKHCRKLSCTADKIMYYRLKMGRRHKIVDQTLTFTTGYLQQIKLSKTFKIPLGIKR